MPNLVGWGAHVPWFIYDLTNKQLITTRVIPGDISDRKAIVLAEIRVPGLNYDPVFPGGSRNRKVAFQLQLVKRDNVLGNVAMLRQFDQLRQNAVDILALGNDSQFQGKPKVLYWWGTGSVPLEWYVSRCEWVNPQGWINGMGNPQLSLIDIELTLDEKSPLYLMEDMARRAMAITGELTGVAGLLPDSAVGGRPPF